MKENCKNCQTPTWSRFPILINEHSEDVGRGRNAVTQSKVLHHNIVTQLRLGC